MAEARILYLATAGGVVQLANPGKSARWREIGRALAGEDVRAVVASPTDALRAYAGGANGVARTTNGGASWDRVHGDSIYTLAFDAEGNIFAGTERGVVLASEDGETWREEDAFSAPVVQIVKLDDNTLLSIGSDGMVCERDGGAWRPRELQVPFIRGVAASHADPRELYIVNKRSLVTSLCSQRLAEQPTGAVLVLAGEHEVVLIGTQGPLLRSDDAGSTLTPVDGPTNVTVLVSPPRFVDQSFAGTQNGALWFSADRGRTWSELASGYGAIRSIAFARAL
jgi:photosystem II stability/assembly factor-like uncharacterized protein